MTYKEKYYEIINTGLKEKPETGYYEGHHIVPKSICPLLKKSYTNIVYLTAKNHFLAHYYIWKWYKDELHEKKWAKSMCYALHRMKQQLMKSNDIERLSDLYEEVRIEMGKIVSERMKGNKCNKGNIPWNKGISFNKGKKHPFYGKHHSEDSRKKMSLSHIGKMVGEKHPNFGKHLSDELRNKILQTRIKFPVVQYTLDFKFVSEYESSREAERQTGVAHTNINKCCKGKYYQTNGYIWVYKEDICYFF